MTKTQTSLGIDADKLKQAKVILCELGINFSEAELLVRVLRGASSEEP